MKAGALLYLEVGHPEVVDLQSLLNDVVDDEYDLYQD